MVATHKYKLRNRRDTVWKERLQGSVPVWRLPYKPPLNKRTGDLQSRILQGYQSLQEIHGTTILQLQMTLFFSYVKHHKSRRTVKYPAYNLRHNLYSTEIQNINTYARYNVTEINVPRWLHTTERE